MLCQFCNEDRKLIRAHIIARCLHKPLLDPSGPMMLLSKDLCAYPKRVQTGQYDEGILCADCDNGFSPWERYTAELLMMTGAHEKSRQENPDQDFYTIAEYDYASPSYSTRVG